MANAIITKKGGGGGIKAASGVVAQTKTTKMTVNGVGFKPKKIAIIADSYTGDSDYDVIQGCKGIYIDVENNVSKHWNCFSATTYSSAPSSVTYTVNDDGFTITVPSGTWEQFVTESGKNKYYWIALG